MSERTDKGRAKDTIDFARMSISKLIDRIGSDNPNYSDNLVDCLYEACAQLQEASEDLED